MPHPDDICYHALLEVTHRANSDYAKVSPGAYVNAWTFAATEQQAHDEIELQARIHFDAVAIEFHDFAPADPRIDMDISDAESRAKFEVSSVVFSTPIGWRRPRWWQF